MAFDSLEFQGMFIGNYNAFIYEDLSTIIVVEKYIFNMIFLGIPNRCCTVVSASGTVDACQA